MSLNYYRGSITEGEISISPQDRGLQHGDGVFETMLVVDGAAVWRQAHLARRTTSAG